MEESAKFSTKFLLGTRNKLRRRPRETTIQERWGGGGVRCDLIYPYIHQHEREAESHGEAFVVCFAIEKINIYPPEISSAF